MTSTQEIRQILDEYACEEDIDKAVQALLLREREKRIELINLYGTPMCNNLHHSKKHQHKAIESCPVETRIKELSRLSGDSHE